ncbi:MAG: sigma-70 family RNA polymerase sigma factor [Nannocystaceae bacterium]|nr:sigma-70 family RNA polymerase sigma factor [Nannocystaceae bacterium]
MVNSDEELLESWKTGDRRAGNALFQRHFEPVRRFFVNKTDGDVAELVQNTFVRCLDAAQRFEGRSSFRTFLFAIAHNLLREHYRARVRDRRNEDLGAFSIEDLGAGPSTLLQAKREQQVLLRALRKIPMKDQVILELYYWEKLTAGQIGEVMEVPEDTARSRIRSGKARLKQAIAEVGEEPGVVESTAGDLDGWAAKVRLEFG